MSHSGSFAKRARITFSTYKARRIVFWYSFSRLSHSCPATHRIWNGLMKGLLHLRIFDYPHYKILMFWPCQLPPPFCQILHHLNTQLLLTHVCLQASNTQFSYLRLPRKDTNLHNLSRQAHLRHLSIQHTLQTRLYIFPPCCLEPYFERSTCDKHQCVLTNLLARRASDPDFQIPVIEITFLRYVSNSEINVLACHPIPHIPKLSCP